MNKLFAKLFLFLCGFILHCFSSYAEMNNEQNQIIQDCKLEVEYLKSFWSGKKKKYVNHYDELYALKRSDNVKFDATLKCPDKSYEVNFWITHSFARDEFHDNKIFQRYGYKEFYQKKLGDVYLYIFSYTKNSKPEGSTSRYWIKICNDSYEVQQEMEWIANHYKIAKAKLFCEQDKYYLEIKINSTSPDSIGGYFSYGTREHRIILHSGDDIWHLDDPEKTVGIMLSFLSALNFNLK